MDGMMRLTGMTSGEVMRSIHCAIGFRKSARKNGSQKRNSMTNSNSCAKVLMRNISAGFIRWSSRATG